MAGWTLPMSKSFLQVPIGITVRVLLGACGISAACSYLNSRNFQPVDSMTPEYKSKENVIAVRTDAPPVFLNPISNRIPGNVLGPEDLERS